MIPERIVRLVAGGESETVEFKKTTGERREAAKTACAMLNHRGGTIIFGVTPDGDATGQHIGERTIEGVSAEFQRIDPPAFPSVERVHVGDEREVLVVRVSRGDMAPYRYRDDAYRRVGNTNQRMSRHDENQMFMERAHAERRWENQPATGWTAKDLDIAEIRRTVIEAIRSGRLDDAATSDPEDMLRGLGLFKDGELLRAAVALFGNNRRVESELTQCLLRVARFSGIDRSEFLDNRQFRGNAFTLLAHAERFLRDHLPIAGRITSDSFTRIDEPLYPLAALREALANAICHRDYTSGGGSISIGIYDDRLEITSIGSLHFGLTPEMLFLAHESRPWNPLIAGVFYRRGIIEQWGRGTIKMAELMSDAGLPRPEIEDIGGSVTVRFRPSHYVPPLRVGHNLTERQRNILAILHNNPNGIAFRHILTYLDIPHTEQQVRYDLDMLRKLGLATARGRGRGARWERL